MLLHTALAEQLARERHADLIRGAERHRLARLAIDRPKGSVRARIGWWLVEVGLRLAVAKSSACA